MQLQLRQASERISQLQGGAASSVTGRVPVLSTPAPAPAARVNTSGGVEQVASMIAMAQQFIEQAQQEAESKAREMTTVAQERAREIVAEARSRAEDEVNRLNGLKQRLSEDVDTLTRQLNAERTRLAAVLAEFSRWVENSLHVGGTRASSPPSASAPSALAPRSVPIPAPVPETARPLAPPPAPPAPAPALDQPTIGQVLNFEQPPRDDRS
jgi:vacuolar-type H+-ATPase subunit H